jgi:hypothetical protein
MKKLFLIALTAIFATGTASAQDPDDKMLFNHLSVGVTTGTPGLIGFDVATTCTPYLQIRAGMAIMPNIKYNTKIKLAAGDVNRFNNLRNQINQVLETPQVNRPDLVVTEEVKREYDVQGKLGFTNGKILFDVFPFKSTGFPFFITVGAYFGGKQIINVYNRDDGSLRIVNQANKAIDAYNQYVPVDKQVNNIYATQGDYKELGPDKNGNVEFQVKVNGFKPYLGIGFGRPVPMNKRVGVQVELGCMFWSTPKVTFSGNKDIDIEKDKAGDKDVGKAIDIISKFSVWPCLNFRICGKIL